MYVLCRVRTGRGENEDIYIYNVGTLFFLDRERESIYEMNE